MREDDRGTETGSNHDFNAPDLFVVAVLSLAAIGSLFFVDVGLHLFLQFNPGAFIATIAPLLLLLPLPMAYVAAISHERVHWEFLGTLITVPFIHIGPAFAAVSVGLVLGGLMVSYKAKSIYKGTNAGWTYFKASGGAVTVLAIVLGVVVANSYATTPELRQDIRDNLTEQTLDIAMEYADLESVQGDAVNAQQDAVSEVAATLTENTSTTSITATEAAVFMDVDDDGTFSTQQQQVLRSSFSDAKQTIPPELAGQTDQLVQDHFSTPTGTGSGLDTETIQGVAEPRVRNLLSSIIAPSREAAIAVFFIMFSLVMLFKLPFELVGAIYAFILGGVRSKLHQHSG